MCIVSAHSLQRIEGLDALVNLEELWLGKNKLPKLEVCATLMTVDAMLIFQRHQNLDKLKKLRILSLQSNRITKIENIERLENLEELYLSHNGVERIEGLEHNVSDSRMI